MATASLPSIYVWLVVIFPFVGALLTPLLARLGGKVRDYAAVAFSGLSALFAFLLLIPVLQGETISVYDSIIPTSVPWISELGINMGVLYDPYTIIIVNVVTSIGLLIMVYSLDYMRGEHGLTRYWFFMNFFLGNMLLIVLSNNLLSLFIGWEGVGPLQLRADRLPLPRRTGVLGRARPARRPWERSRPTLPPTPG